MTGPYGIPYEELAMQQKEAEEGSMKSAYQLAEEIILSENHDEATALIESRDAEIHALYAPVVEALRKIKSRGPIPTHQTDEGLRTRCLSCQYAWDGDEHEEHDPNCAYVIALAAIKEVKG